MEINNRDPVTGQFTHEPRGRKYDLTGQVFKNKLCLKPAKALDGYPGWLVKCLNCGNIYVVRTNNLLHTYKVKKTNNYYCPMCYKPPKNYNDKLVGDKHFRGRRSY